MSLIDPSDRSNFSGDYASDILSRPVTGKHHALPQRSRACYYEPPWSEVAERIDRLRERWRRGEGGVER